MRGLCLIMVLLSTQALPAAQPVPVAYRLSPADDGELLGCLQQAISKTPTLRLDNDHPRWLLDLALYRQAGDAQAWLAVSVSRVFDNKRELNAWMAGFDQPLPYAAMNSLQRLTYGLVRPISHWVEPTPVPLDCAGALQRALEYMSRQP